MSAGEETVTPELLLRAYAQGLFPMSDSRDDPDIFWVDPHLRGILPLDTFHVPKRLQRTVRQDVFAVVADRDFAGVIDACAAPRPDHPESWINGRIRSLYLALFSRGVAHSLECYDASGALVGGLYGVSLGRAFFGESMFSRARDASKVALVHLVARLKAGGYSLLDTQFVTEHLRQFGAVEIPRKRYRALLAEALKGEADFYSLGGFSCGTGMAGVPEGGAAGVAGSAVDGVAGSSGAPGMTSRNPPGASSITGGSSASAAPGALPSSSSRVVGASSLPGSLVLQLTTQTS
ncbi:MAG: leucyl/phenylalanyl-tRNA--protein transferase [Alphaproteobacteria bacterium]|nr:leucyl/phenylalanyl-tRNA--protein transferase [Alphaproteobacteria bacterium]